jgi:hypothetical protein
VPAGADGTPVQPQQHQQQQEVGPASAEGPPSSNLTSRLTIQLVATYRKCSSAAGAPGAVVPRRILTRPAAGVKNNGWDNETSDLILATQVREDTVLFYYMHTGCIQCILCVAWHVGAGWGTCVTLRGREQDP